METCEIEGGAVSESKILDLFFFFINRSQNACRCLTVHRTIIYLVFSGLSLPILILTLFKYSPECVISSSYQEIVNNLPF